MQVKDLIVMGDVRILGKLYTPTSAPAQNPSISAPRNSKLVPVGNLSTEVPQNEGEIYWYYS